MRITLLAVPDCPNAPVLRERIALVLGDREALVEQVEVHDPGEAARWGMTGSPTALIDGVDPFAALGTEPSLSCRLYRGADGLVEGAPGVADLRRALEAADDGERAEESGAAHRAAVPDAVLRGRTMRAFDGAEALRLLGNWRGRIIRSEVVQVKCRQGGPR